MDSILPRGNYNIYHYLREILAEIDSPVIFEFGVHWAEDTHRIMNTCKNKPLYYGFEPDSRNLEIIENSGIAKLTYPLNLISGAVGSKNESATLYRSVGVHKPSGNIMTGASSIRKPKVVLKRHAWITFPDKEVVTVYNLDHFCKARKIDHIDFIWCDTQGNEYEMLLGAKEMMKKTKFLFCEYSDAELYAGQKPLKDIMKLLPNWKLIHDFKTDVLLQNMKY